MGKSPWISSTIHAPTRSPSQPGPFVRARREVAATAVHAFDRAAIRDAMCHNSGNAVRAARELGIAQPLLYQYAKGCGLSITELRSEVVAELAALEDQAV